jgi:ABC-2 type transport system permease protein
MSTELFAAEWIKLRSVRSTPLVLALSAILVIGIGIVVTGSSTPDDGLDPVRDGLIGGLFAQLAMGTLGVLAMSSEHATGLIRTTFAVTPQRHRLLAAKVAVLGTVSFVAGVVIIGTAFFINHALLHSVDQGVSLADPGVFRAVSYAVLYLVIVTLLGVGIGAVIRHTAGGVAVLFSLLFLIPQILDRLPQRWRADVVRFGLHSASISATSVRPHPQLLAFGPTASILVCAAYAIVAVAGAFFLIGRRDA